MKFSAATLFAATSLSLLHSAAATPLDANPALIKPQNNAAIEKREYHGHANFVSQWTESALNRWRWAFAGATCDQARDSFKAHGVISNFQCWDSGDGITYFMDVSAILGEMGDTQQLAGIRDLTGQNCCDLALPSWALARCVQMPFGWTPGC